MRHDGSSPVEDHLGRVYHRQVAPGKKWCAFHETEEPAEDFSPDQSYCRRAMREYQRARRRAIADERPGRR